MPLRILSILTFALGAFLFSSCSTDDYSNYDDSLALFRSGKPDSDFVMPLAPSPSAKPSTSLPKLGRDKHGVAIYHSKQRNRVVRTTAYTHSESDHLVYGRKNAIGTLLKYSTTVRSAAADWSFYPLGTKFKIKGQPYLYVVDDYGSALTGTGTIDIYQPSKALMKKWGRRYVEVTIIQWGSAEKSMEVLGSRTRYWHCREMANNLKSGTPRVYYVKN